MEIIQGDCLEVMQSYDDNHFSSIVTDPPYGLKFMGKSWDHGIPGVEFWKEMLRIAKPGAYLLAFGGSRTYHRLACAIEDAGWEIRDCLMWIYGSGFPKSHNHFGIEGYGTALKPAYEPIIMAMKPCHGTFKQNAEKWGQAGINIDGCRIGTEDTRSICSMTAMGQNSGWNNHHNKEVMGGSSKGRWPANVLFDEEAGTLLDEQSGIKASRFFYCAKASTSERNEGLDGMPEKESPYAPMGINTDEGIVARGGNPEYQSRKQQNFHPTVKPLRLMEYLIKLVMPPKDGILLDPFAGSGSTILAAKNLGFDAVGIEKDEEYCKIARARVKLPPSVPA